jgi:hypothetical protein
MTERIELLDDLGAEFARVAAEAERKQSEHFASATALTVALTVVVLLAGAAFSVPATRGAVGGIVDSLAGWVAGDSDKAPGRELQPGESLPSWFGEAGGRRLIAKTGGVGLYVGRSDSDEGPWLWFGLGEGAPLAMGSTVERWRERLGDHSVVVLGPALFGPRDVLDERGRFALLGITAPEVERVELRYFEGPPLIGSVGDGGFVVLPDAWRRLRELIAYDRSGRILEHADLAHPDSTYLCEKEPDVCPSR